ncbi:MAG: exopolyphosphatase, partial [Burkholderiaceae bacterium]|nr:exopolyphosphatase [Burkholderiaceae bacterium]
MLAAIDLGSNSFRLHVGQHDGEKIAVVASAREPTRLAAGLDQAGYLTHAAMERATVALERLGEVLQQYPLDEVRAVATNTMRIAGNAAEFLPIAEKALGYPIEIISGEEEARLIYLGIANQLAIPGERRLVIDIGGGSTELILGCGKEIERAESIGIGTVQQSMTFFPDGRIDASAFEQAILYARSRFEDVFSPQQKPWKNVY